MVNPQEDKQKPTNSDKLQALIMQEWAAISQDVAQLIDSMACQTLWKLIFVSFSKLLATTVLWFEWDILDTID